MTKVAVRDGQKVVPTCPKCECRLEKQANGDYTHFMKWANWIAKDARGCSCTLLFEKFAIVDRKVTLVWV